jgi:hypothetical protein
VLAFMRDGYKREIEKAIAQLEQVAELNSLHIQTQRDRLFEQLWSELLVVAKGLIAMEGISRFASLYFSD